MDWLQEWTKDWSADIKKMLSPPANQYDVNKVADNNKFSFVCVPSRIMEKWVLVTGDVAKKRCGWVVFDEWDWKKVEYVITFMAQKLQRAVVKSGLLLSGSVEDNIDDWAREKPIRFYSDSDRLECV